MKSVIVFGGSGRIGKVICKALLKDNTVISADIKDSLTTQHYNEFIKCNVCNYQSVYETFQQVYDTYGSIDSVVITTYIKSHWYGRKWDNALTSDMCAFLSSNLGSTIDIIKCCKEFEVNHVVVLSSMYGSKVPDNDLYQGSCIDKTPLEYAMTKAALNQMVRYLSKEMHINSVAPGGIESEDMDGAFKLGYCCKYGKFTKENEVAAIVEYLLSDYGQAINGQVIYVDHGASV